VDRRAFLRFAGVGAAAVIAAPKLILPPVRQVVESPKRRVFLPPNGGWIIGVDPASGGGWTAQRLAIGRNGQYLVVGPPSWDVEYEQPWEAVVEALLTAAMHDPSPAAVTVGDAQGYLIAMTVNGAWDDRVTSRVHFHGYGVPPTRESLPPGATIQVQRDVHWQPIIT
jgi:hypothetical protein